MVGNVLLVKTEELLTALGGEQGEEVWSIPFAELVDQDDYAGGTQVLGDVGVVADPEGEIVGFDVATGAILWRTAIDQPGTASAQTLVGITSDRVVTMGWYGIQVRDLQDGSLVWELPDDVCWQWDVLVDGNTVYAFSSGRIQAIDVATGTGIWLAPGPSVLNDVAIVDDLLVAADERYVGLYSTTDGRRALQVTPRRPSASFAVVAGQVIVAFDERVVAYDLDELSSYRGGVAPTTTAPLEPCGVARSPSD